MDTREEEFALMREPFLRAALGEAEAAGGFRRGVHRRGGPGAHGTLRGDGRPLPGHGGREQPRHLGGEFVFRLTAQGVAEAKGEG